MKHNCLKCVYSHCLSTDLPCDRCSNIDLGSVSHYKARTGDEVKKTTLESRVDSLEKEVSDNISDIALLKKNGDVLRDMNNLVKGMYDNLREYVMEMEMERKVEALAYEKMQEQIDKANDSIFETVLPNEMSRGDVVYAWDDDAYGNKSEEMCSVVYYESKSEYSGHLVYMCKADYDEGHAAVHFDNVSKTNPLK